MKGNIELQHTNNYFKCKYVNTPAERDWQNGLLKIKLNVYCLPEIH